MLQVTVTELRKNLDNLLEQASLGEEIQITSHEKTIARLIPEISQFEAATKRLEALRGTMIIGDILEPLENSWRSYP